MNLPALVAADFDAPHPQSFGGYVIHRQMTLTQLDELLKLRPGTLNETAFVSAYVTNLQPGTDYDWKRDRDLAKAYFDRTEGSYSKGRFIEYLSLPRNQPYMAKRLLDAEIARKYPATLEADYAAITLMPRVGDDSQLVRNYLLHFLVDAANTKDFEPYINDIVLKHFFVEAKLTTALATRSGGCRSCRQKC